MSSSDILFHAADATKTELTQVNDGVYGRSNQVYEVGPFLLKSTLEVFSNHLMKRDGSFFIHVCENLWGFLIAGAHTAFYIVDGEKAGLSAATVTKYDGETILQTLKKLYERKALTAVWKWDLERCWYKADLSKEIPQ